MDTSFTLEEMVRVCVPGTIALFIVAESMGDNLPQSVTVCLNLIRTILSYPHPFFQCRSMFLVRDPELSKLIRELYNVLELSRGYPGLNPLEEEVEESQDSLIQYFKETYGEWMYAFLRYTDTDLESIDEWYALINIERDMDYFFGTEKKVYTKFEKGVTFHEHLVLCFYVCLWVLFYPCETERLDIAPVEEEYRELITYVCKRYLDVPRDRFLETALVNLCNVLRTKRKRDLYVDVSNLGLEEIFGGRESVPFTFTQKLDPSDISSRL